MTMTDDLVAFLRARVDEDERVALATNGNSIFDGTGIVSGNYQRVVVVGSHIARFIARYDPARALREVEAKRMLAGIVIALMTTPSPTLELPTIVRRYQREVVEPNDRQVADQILRTLAATYSDHPDYRQEWSAEVKGA